MSGLETIVNNMLTYPRPVQVIISSAFETSIAISQYACLARVIDQHWASSQSSLDSTGSRNEARQDVVAASQLLPSACAHGLATEDWFQRSNCQDLLQPLLHLSPSLLATSCTDEPTSHQAISAQAAEDLLKQICCSIDTAAAAADTSATVSGQHALLKHTLDSNTQLHRQVQESESMHEVITAAGMYNFSVRTSTPTSPSTASGGTMDTGVTAGNSRMCDGVQASRSVCIFLHGFLGDKEDWLPIMRALALTHHCIAVDLPGHGNTLVTPAGALASMRCPCTDLAPLLQHFCSIVSSCWLAAALQHSLVQLVYWMGSLSYSMSLEPGCRMSLHNMQCCCY